MANVKISELPNATSLSNGDSFPVVQGGVTKQAARSVLFASPTFTGTTTAAILTATGDVTFDGGAFVFNDSGADKDARFEGDTDANLLFLDASTDRVGIGTSTPAAKLDVDGAAIVRGFLTPTDAIKLGANTSAPSTTDAFIYRPADNTLAFGTASSERMRLDSFGNLGLGVTPSAWSGVIALQLQTGASLTGFSNTTNLVQNAYFNGSWRYISTAAAALSQVTQGAHQWFTAPSGTAGNAITFTQAMTLDASGDLLVGVTSAPANGAGAKNVVFNNINSVSTFVKIANAASGSSASDGFDLIMGVASDAYVYNRENGPLIFGTNNTERARITSAGDFIHQVNGAAPSLSTNSTMSFELTSNTSLKIVVRGTDGTTRSVSLTLA